MVGATPIVCSTHSGGYQVRWGLPLVPCVVPLVLGIKYGAGYPGIIWRQLHGKTGKNSGQTSGQVADRTSVRRTGGADRYRTGVCPADRWTGQTPVRRFFTGQVSVWRLSAIFARLADPHPKWPSSTKKGSPTLFGIWGTHSNRLVKKIGP